MSNTTSPSISDDEQVWPHALEFALTRNYDEDVMSALCVEQDKLIYELAYKKQLRRLDQFQYGMTEKDTDISSI